MAVSAAYASTSVFFTPSGPSMPGVELLFCATFGVFGEVSESDLDFADALLLAAVKYRDRLRTWHGQRREGHATSTVGP